MVLAKENNVKSGLLELCKLKGKGTLCKDSDFLAIGDQAENLEKRFVKNCTFTIERVYLL